MADAASERSRSRSRSRSPPVAKAAEPAAAAAAGPAAAAAGPRRVDFRLRFNQVVALKSFMEVVAAVLRETEFNVVKTDAFAGITVQGIDATHVALVKGRLSADTEVNVECATFCVTLKNVVDALGNAHPQHFVDFVRYEGDTNVVLRIYEPGVSTSQSRFTLRTLAKEVEIMDLSDLGYDYYVEAELTALKNALRGAKSQKAESITLKICEKRGGERAPQLRNLWFVVEYSSEELQGHFAFRSTVKLSAAGDGPITIVAVDGKAEELGEGGEDDEDLNDGVDTLYCGNFTAEFIFNFLRSMERFQVTFRLSNDKPLVLDYALGCATSDSVRFILAPRCTD
jgi:hypothetical protein